MRRLLAAACLLAWTTLGDALPVAGAESADPPDVAALPWREACHLDSAQVDPPLARMPDYLFEDWGLPRSRESAAWSAGALIGLGRVLETGQFGALGPPDPAGAARLYCLALRRDGDSLAALFLARLHARGQGVAFAPSLTRHMARVAAPSWEVDSFDRLMVRLPAEVLPDDGMLRARLEQGRGWWERTIAQSPQEIEKTALAYIAGDGVPNSDVLGEQLYLQAIQKVAGTPNDIRILLRYIQKRALESERDRRHPASVANDLPSSLKLALSKLHTRAEIYRLAEAQHMFGRLHLSGRLVPPVPAAAYAWLLAAQRDGLSVQPHLAVAAARLSSAQKRKIERRLSRRRLPPLIYSADDAKAFDSELSSSD